MRALSPAYDTDRDCLLPRKKAKKARAVVGKKNKEKMTKTNKEIKQTNRKPWK